MKIEVLSAHSPVWSDEGQSRIDCMVQFSHLRVEVPFTASRSGSGDHGRELFERCLSGDLGPIAPFVASATTETEAHALDQQQQQPEWLAKWPELLQFLAEANAENARGTIRGIGLVWGCMLEEMLGRLLRSRQVKPNSNFDKAIEQAFEIGVVSEVNRQHLHRIRKIRNRCAHEWNLDFGNARVLAVQNCFEGLREAFFPDLNPTDDLETLMKLVYSQACCSLILRFAEDH